MKPCPFCGHPGKVVIVRAMKIARVNCTFCDAHGPNFEPPRTLEDELVAVAAEKFWDQREEEPQ